MLSNTCIFCSHCYKENITECILLRPILYNHQYNHFMGNKQLEKYQVPYSIVEWEWQKKAIRILLKPPWRNCYTFNLAQINRFPCCVFSSLPARYSWVEAAEMLERATSCVCIACAVSSTRPCAQEVLCLVSLSFAIACWNS